METTATFTQSSLTAFAECPEKYRLSQLEGGTGIKPRMVDPKFAAGTIMHNVTANIYKHKSIKDAERYIREQFGIYARSYAHAPATLQDIETITEYTIGAAQGYYQRYKKSIMGDGNVIIEECSIPIRFPIFIQGKKYIIHGEIDMIGHMRKSKRPVIAEVKYTADISQNFKFDVEMSPQTLVYLIGYYEQYSKGDREVVTMFDYIRKPGIRLRRAESLRQYMQRCIDEYKNRPEHYFHRAFIRRSSADILRFKQELIGMVRAEQFVESRNLWYRNRKACNARGRCPFFDICAFGPTDGIMANFVRKSQQHEELAKHVSADEEE